MFFLRSPHSVIAPQSNQKWWPAVFRPCVLAYKIGIRHGFAFQHCAGAAPKTFHVAIRSMFSLREPHKTARARGPPWVPPSSLISECRVVERGGAEGSPFLGPTATGHGSYFIYQLTRNAGVT